MLFGDSDFSSDELLYVGIRLADWAFTFFRVFFQFVREELEFREPRIVVRAVSKLLNPGLKYRPVVFNEVAVEFPHR